MIVNEQTFFFAEDLITILVMIILILRSSSKLKSLLEYIPKQLSSHD